MTQLKHLIDVEVLEQHYCSLVHEENGKKYISVQAVEKMMLLEIYKALCADSHDNIDNSKWNYTEIATKGKKMESKIEFAKLKNLYRLCKKFNSSYGDSDLQDLYRAQAVIEARIISCEAFGSPAYTYALYSLTQSIDELFGDIFPLLRLFEEQGQLSVYNIEYNGDDGCNQHED